MLVAHLPDESINFSGLLPLTDFRKIQMPPIIEKSNLK